MFDRELALDTLSQIKEMCFGVFMLTPSFITLWIGKEYVLDSMTLLLMTAILFINLSRTTVDAYINAYGLFGDIWAPVTEASINIGMSVLLGYFFGLHGVLLGVLISLLIVVFAGNLGSCFVRD